MVRLCILLNSLLYICKSELRKSQIGIKGFFFATVGGAGRHTCWLEQAAGWRGWMADIRNGWNVLASKSGMQVNDSQSGNNKHSRELPVSGGITGVHGSRRCMQYISINFLSRVADQKRKRRASA